MSNYFIDDAEDGMGRCLVLTSPWTDGLKKVIEQENISVLRLSRSAGWQENDLSFLINLPNLRGIEIYAWDMKDLTPLQSTSNIEYLGLQCEFTSAPDFSNFHKLEICKLFWRPKAKTILDSSNIRLLNIVNYPFQDLQAITKLSKLESLQLASRKLTSLSGIEAFRVLKILDLVDCYNFESLLGVEKCSLLETVELETCKKLYDISLLSNAKNLKNVVMTDCGKIKSLKPLTNCPLLENITFTGDTDVEDGNFMPLFDLLKLKRMRFGEKRHYSHNRDQVASILSNS